MYRQNSGLPCLKKTLVGKHVEVDLGQLATWNTSIMKELHEVHLVLFWSEVYRYLAQIPSDGKHKCINILCTS